MSLFGQRLGGQRPPRNQRTQQREAVAKAERTPLSQRLGEAWRGWKARAEQPEGPAESASDEVDEEEASSAGWFGVLGWLAAILCIGIVALAGLNLHDFQTRVESAVVSKFEVVGASRVTPQQVEKASGLRWGSPLTSIDRNQTSRAIEKLAWVRQAEVEPELPNKVRLMVSEYQPYALLLGEGRMMIVDSAGFVFKEAELGEVGDLPVITGFAPSLSRDAHIKAAHAEDTPDQRRLRGILRLLEAHGHSVLAERFPLSEVHWDPVLGITLVSARDGTEVRLGRGLELDPQRAFRNIHRVLDQAEREGQWLRYALLDDELRPDRVVVRTEPVGQAPQGHLGGAVHAGGAGGVELPKAPTPSQRVAPPDPDEPAD